MAHIFDHMAHMVENMCHMGAKLNMPKCAEKISGSFGICDFLKFLKSWPYGTIIAQNWPKKAKITGYSQICVPYVYQIIKILKFQLLKSPLRSFCI